MAKKAIEQVGVGADVFKADKITEQHIAGANIILKQYKDAKNSIDQRIIENEKWFRMRHNVRRDVETADANQTSRSGWMFNSIVNKHADAMDNFPEVSLMPRAADDKEEATRLTSIIPLILEQNDYEQTYNDKWWYKLKNGTAATGVFWNTSKHNGLGDVDIKVVDILDLFWEPGITNIQDSRHVFNVKLIDNEVIQELFPEVRILNGREEGTALKYSHDDSIDVSNKSEVVDWYYKKKGKLQYCKFVGNQILYASENDANYKEEGYYNHGKYPFVIDIMFNIAGNLTGFGYIDSMKAPQTYIDDIDGYIKDNVKMLSKPRWLKGNGAGEVNEEEFLDWNKSIINVSGSVDETNLRQYIVNALPNTVQQVRLDKIEELKETSNNRDFSQGASASGVTAAAAIAALQEAGSKTSRDMIKASYRAFKEEIEIVIELIRQFYDEARTFRIEGDEEDEFVDYSNQNIKAIDQGTEYGQSMGFREPVFDISIKAHKANPFSKAAHNELAKELYNGGFFDAARADQALLCLDMMDFEGKKQLMTKIKNNGTMFEQLQAMQQQMAQIMGAIPGMTQGQPQAAGTIQGPSNAGQTMANRSRDQAANAAAPQ